MIMFENDEEVADRRSERERMLDKARAESKAKIAQYGSIDKWPALLLTRDQFSVCTCGCARLSHRMAGTDRGACACGRCRLFVAQWPTQGGARR